MQYLIEFEVFDAPLAPDTIEALRAKAFAFFAERLTDPRILSIGHFVDGRHGFMLAELSSHEEVLSLAGPFLDNVKYTVKPVIPMARFLENAAKMFG